MNQFDKLFSDSVEADLKFIKKVKELPNFQGFLQRVDEFLKPIIDEISECKRNGKLSDDNTGGNLSSRPSIKENIWPSGEGAIRSTRTRSQRNAFKESTHQNTEKSWSNVQVKAEKLSILPATKTSIATAVQVPVKTEAEEMPAPTRLPPRKKRPRAEEPMPRVTRSKIKQEKKSIRGGSDVIIQEVPVPTVVLDDESEGKVETEVQGTQTQTRQRVKKTAKKRSSSNSKESDKKRSKPEDSSADATKFDDAVSSTPPLPQPVNSKNNPNATFVASSPINKDLNKKQTSKALNSTVVVEKPVVVLNPDDLMTDDESEDDREKNVKKTAVVHQTVVKSKKQQVFSPFESSPVKKRVEAFEKLGAEAGTLPPRLTRTKTRAMKKQEDESTEVDGQAEYQGQTRNAVKEKAKLFTPTAPSKIAVLKSQTATKYGSKNTSLAESSMSNKSVSAMKASQAEYRDREKRRREKEEDAQKKREAQIQAQMELRRKRNEEKQLKAQQQREALEKEKQKALEAQRLRDEQKHKQILAEQEEKKQKAREEYEQKRLQVKMKAIEEKKREQMRMMEEKKKAEMLASKDQEMVRLAQKQRQKGQQEKEEEHKQKPTYMREPIPYLPLDDRYDSDEEAYMSDKRYPSWSSESNLLLAQKLVIGAGERLKNTFFLRQAETADLQEIFEVIDPRKLKRNSSAVWQKPPRYTLLPTIDQDDENESD